jgi:protein-L-isoaspartate O-methyltransferase
MDCGAASNYLMPVVNRAKGVSGDLAGELSTFLALQHRVARILSYLRVGLGNRVLEIGTGTGFSAAALATIVGSGGSVAAIDGDPIVTERARIAQPAYGGRLMFFTGPPVQGWRVAGPYDAILSWRTVARVPAAWLSQCMPRRSVIVTPILLANASQLVGLLKVGADEECQPVGAYLLPDPDFGGTRSGAPQPVRLHGTPDGYTAHLPADVTQ